MSKKNLLDETKDMLKANDKSPKDVEWVGTSSQWFTWEEFTEIANVTYDSGYGGVNIQQDLKIVGKDFWLERDSYDGAEGWDFKTKPTKPEKHARIEDVESNFGHVTQVEGDK